MPIVSSPVAARAPSRQKCYEILRRMVVCGQIAPGARLAEVEWSERLQVHRGAVREALALLEHDGLLTAGKKGGFFVPILSDFEIEELVQSRCVLETGALKLIVMRQLGIAAFNPLLELCETMRHLHEADIELGFCEADYMFHIALVALSGNSRLIRLHAHSTQLIFNISAVATRDELRQLRSITLDEHRELCQLMMGGKTAEGVRLLERHLTAVTQTNS